MMVMQSGFFVVISSVDCFSVVLVLFCGFHLESNILMFWFGGFVFGLRMVNSCYCVFSVSSQYYIYIPNFRALHLCMLFFFIPCRYCC